MDYNHYYLSGDQLHGLRFHLLGVDAPEAVRILKRVEEEQCLGLPPEPYRDYELRFVKKGGGE